MINHFSWSKLHYIDDDFFPILIEKSVSQSDRNKTPKLLQLEIVWTAAPQITLENAETYC